MLPCRDPYGYVLTTSPEAADAFSRGLLDVLRLREGALAGMASAVALALLAAMTTRGQAQLAAGPNTVGVIDAGKGALTEVVSIVADALHYFGVSFITDPAPAQ